MARRRQRKRRKRSSGTVAPGEPLLSPERSVPFGRPTVLLVFLLFAGLSGSWLLVQGLQSATLRRPESPPNVLLVSVDTLRADHLGTYGASRPTETIDRLGLEGVVFEKAVSHVPITLPAHASLFTGRYPLAHGVRDNGSYRLPEDERTLAEAFRDAGYRTGGFVGAFALDSRFGLDQGFDHYDDFYGDSSSLDEFAISERGADDVLEPARAWLARGNDANPWFAFVHLYDPHAPYAAPAPFGSGGRDDAYAGEVAYVDDALGRFLDDLESRGSLENTLIVLTADHGEGLGEHGEKTHGMFAYDSTLHVPLLMRWKGVLPAGVRVPSRVRLIDVAPTLLELTGVDAMENVQGASLVSTIVDPGAGRDRESYFEALAFHLNRDWAPLTGLYRGGLKYVDLPIPELYDLDRDPGEIDNVFSRRGRSARELSEALGRLLEGRESVGEARSDRVDSETVERLRSLGYLVSPRSEEPRADYTAEDDPKRLIALSDRLDAGVAAHVAGRPEEAMLLFRSILEERPGFSNAYANLAHVLHETGRLDEAIAVVEEALERGSSTRNLLGRLGVYLQEAGRLEESIDVLEAVVEQYPDYAEAYNYLGVSYSRSGRLAESLRAFDRVLELDSSYASAHSNLGSAYLDRRRYAEAERAFRRALELDSGLAGSWNGLGVVYASTDRERDAIDAWKRAIELDPRQYDTLFNLGTLLTRLDRFDEAIVHLERFARTAPADRYGADLPKVRNLVGQLKSRASPSR